MLKVADRWTSGFTTRGVELSVILRKERFCRDAGESLLVSWRFADWDLIVPHSMEALGYVV